ncbi:MAG: beta-propeller domain-containing protein [Bacillota bacterium]
MGYLNNLMKIDRAWLTGIKLISLAVFIGLLIFYVTIRPAWTAPGVANADGVSYRIEGQRLFLSWGEKPTGGYAIAIDSLEVREDTLTVAYSLRAPALGDMVSQAITHPQATALIPGTSTPAKVKLIRNGPNPTSQLESEQLPQVGSLDNLKKLLEQIGENRRYYLDFVRAEAKVTADAAAPSGMNRVTSPEPAQDYSGTNVQVAGVDEADVVKTDGNYIYQVNKQAIKIIRAYPATKLQVSSTISFTDTGFTPQELYVDGNRLVVIGQSYAEHIYQSKKIGSPDVYPPPVRNQFVKALVYDISDRSQVIKIREIEMEGNYLSSRKVGNILYLAANKWINYYRLDEGEDVDLRPYYRDSAAGKSLVAVDYPAIRYFPGCVEPNYLMVAGIDLTKNEPAVISTYLGAGENIYCSEKNLYVALSRWQYTPQPIPTGNKVMAEVIIVPRESKTTVYRLALNEGHPECTGKGEVPGTILNQFSMDEHNGYFRIATTTGEMWRTDEGTSKNNIYVLNDKMAITGRLENIAPGERIYSTRFMGNRVYMVTFRNVDPLFVIDLKNPQKPVILGALKIPGYSDYLHPYDENHIIGFGKDTVEVKVGEGSQAFYTGMKVALFDITDVTRPREMFKEIIGDRGTESELLHNHKAILFSRERNLLAFPVTVMRADRKTSSGMPEYGKFEFQGAYVYRVDLKQGFQLKARISHLTDEDYLKAGHYWYSSDRNVERILYINNGLYTLSKGRVRVHDLSTFKETGNLWL